MRGTIVITSHDVEKYLNEHDKSELSRIIWKVEQLKAAENDTNQLTAEIVDDSLLIS